MISLLIILITKEKNKIDYIYNKYLLERYLNNYKFKKNVDRLQRNMIVFICCLIWGISSAGRAPRLHRGGQRFDPAMLHHI